MASIAGAHVSDESILLSDLSFRGVRRAVMVQFFGTPCELGSPRHSATANPGTRHDHGECRDYSAEHTARPPEAGTVPKVLDAESRYIHTGC